MGSFRRVRWGKGIQAFETEATYKALLSPGSLNVSIPELVQVSHIEGNLRVRSEQHFKILNPQHEKKTDTVLM